uniref:Uncharacterized protein AlNc14C113G6442 n=1 Tax=Albugo laibachii Nc14 TaxID=890382 RepID=F0WIP9_9STRA|nr:conserved hypothetical protein [Albugo laibachii Nc14]|eukprot:CCA21140.1 conserved hypothetical protein [Albugo laibachii Nc14]
MTQITAIGSTATAIAHDAVSALLDTIVQDMIMIDKRPQVESISTDALTDAISMAQSEEKHRGATPIHETVVLLTSLVSDDKVVDLTVEEVMSTIISTVLSTSENITAALATSEHETESGHFPVESTQRDDSSVNIFSPKMVELEPFGKPDADYTLPEDPIANHHLLRKHIDTHDMHCLLGETKSTAETIHVELSKLTLHQKPSSLLIDISLSSTDSDDSDSRDEANLSDCASGSPISISPRSISSDDLNSYSDLMDDNVQCQSSYLPGIPEISTRCKDSTINTCQNLDDSDSSDSVITSSDGSSCGFCVTRSNSDILEDEAISEMEDIPHEVGDEIGAVEPMAQNDYTDTRTARSGSTSSQSFFPDIESLHITRYLRSKSYAPTSAPIFNFPRKEKATSATAESVTEEQPDLTPGCCVSTEYGLGTLVACGRTQGTIVIRLQCSTLSMLMYCRDRSNVHVIPAIRNDSVMTPIGEGQVIDYMFRQRTYLVQLGNEANVSGKRKVERIFFETEIKRQDSGRRNIVQSRFMSTAHKQKESIPNSVEERKRSQTCVQKPTSTTDDSSHSDDRAHNDSIQSSFLSGAFRRAVAASSELSNSTMNYVSKWNLPGQYVQTKYGQGTIKNYDQVEKVVQLELVNCGGVISMHVDDVQYQLKALIGMEVQTSKFGAGKVTAVRASDAIYTVLLHAKPAGKQSDTVYVHESDLWKARRSSIGNLKYSKLKFWK